MPILEVLFGVTQHDFSVFGKFSSTDAGDSPMGLPKTQKVEGVATKQWKFTLSPHAEL